MTRQRPPAVRAVWYGRFDKIRLCLILRHNSDYATVIYGQGRPDPGGCPHQEILPNTHDGRRFGVTKPTYFRAMNERELKVSELVAYVGACSHERFLDFEEMLNTYHAAAFATPIEDFGEPAEDQTLTRQE